MSNRVSWLIVVLLMTLITVLHFVLYTHSQQLSNHTKDNVQLEQKISYIASITSKWSDASTRIQQLLESNPSLRALEYKRLIHNESIRYVFATLTPSECELLFQTLLHLPIIIDEMSIMRSGETLSLTLEIKP